MDIKHLKSIIDQAISDYSQLGESQKFKDTKTAFKQKGKDVLSTIDNNFNPITQDGSPNLGMGIAGHLKYKTDLAEGMTKLKDPNIQELLRMILPFDRKIVVNGKAQYMHPQTQEEYILDFNNPEHAILTGAWARESKGSGNLNKKLYALFANEGFLRHNPDALTKPNKISVMNISEANTLKQIVNSKTDPYGNILPDELFKSLWGHTKND